MDVIDNNSTEERRQSHRYPCTARVDIRGKGTLVLTARTRNICEGGVLLDLTGLPGAGSLQIGDRLTLNLHLAELQPDAQEQVLVPSEIVRLDEAGAGIRFLPGLKQSIKAIQSFLDAFQPPAPEPDTRAAADKPVSSIDRGTVKQAREVLEQVDERQLLKVANELVDSMERTLWEAHEDASNDTERADLAGSAILLGPARRHELIEQLLKELRQPDTPDQATPDPDDSELTLLEQEDFETWLDKSTLVERLEHDLSEPLKVLRSQAAALGGGDQIALQPQRLANALQSAAGGIGVAPQAMHTCFRAMAREIPQLLGGYYREISRELEDIGIVPVGVDTHTRRVHNREAGRVPTGQEAASDDLPAGAASDDRITTDTLVQLLNDLPSGTLTQSDAGGGADSLKSRVIDLLAKQSEALVQQPFEQRLDERLQATDRVLAHILDPAQSTPQANDWVSQLTPLLLSAALQDPAFFKIPQHPLLEIVSQLESLALFADGGEHELAATVNNLVQRTLELSAAEPETFTPVIERLAALEQGMASRYQKNIARAIARLEGQERVELADRAVRRSLDEMLDGRPLHRSVQALIDQAWRNYLHLIHLREGEQGILWQQAIDTLTALYQACGGDELVPAADLPTLRQTLDQVHAGLTYIGFDQALGKHLLKDLLDAGRRDSAGLLKPDEFALFRAQAGDCSGNEEMPGMAGIDEQIWDHTLNAIDGIQVGDAITVNTRHDRTTTRLFWRSKDRSKLAFANAQGQQSHIFTRPELAELLLRKHVVIHQVDQRGVAEQATDKTLDELQQRISYHQTHDPLTGLANQQQIIGRLGEVVAGIRPGTPPHVLALIEIDQHETIREEVSYAAGDALLKLVSQQLQSAFDEHTCLALMTHGRLAIITRATSPQSVHDLGTTLAETVRASELMWEGKRYPLSASIGFSCIDRGHEAPDTFLSEAHIACSTASESGGDQALRFSAEDTQIADKLESLHWRQLVQDAIEHRRIELRGQLIAPIDEDAGLRPHYEVLLNVHDEQGGLLHLERFISAAEAYQLMARVDRLVIEEATAWVAANPDTSSAVGGLAINLSGQSMSDPGLIDFIQQTFEQHQVSPGHFSFEVTETAAIASLDRATAIIEGIQGLGCQVALDDFGTGLSSYSYLKELPVDYVKIDGSFIRNILRDPHDQAIVRSMNEVAHFMGMKTIAEYVEDDPIRDRLARIGVDYAQGYGVEKPMLLKELAARSRLLTHTAATDGAAHSAH